MRIQTAWLEAQQGFALKAQPMMMCGYEVDCEDVLDLTKADILDLHSISGADLACPWKDLASQGKLPPSWDVTRRLMTNGIAAVIVPSFATGSDVADINVVFWTWSPDPPHQVRVIDDEHRLPKDARSWT